MIYYTICHPGTLRPVMLDGVVRMWPTVEAAIAFVHRHGTGGYDFVIYPVTVEPHSCAH